MRRWVLYWSVLALIVLDTAIATGQDNPSLLRLEGLLPAGTRSSITEARATLRFTIDNFNTSARDVRVVVFYSDRPDVQYTRDVWVPAQSRITSWVPIGPAPPNPAQTRRDISYMLYDRTGGETRSLSPTEAAKLPSRAIFYKKREPTTAVYVDGVDEYDAPPAEGSPAAEVIRLARTYRLARGLSESVSLILDRNLPPTPEAFDGIDLFILAGNRLAADPTGRQALRQWVLGGGTLWVLLDQVDADVVAPILGEGVRFQVVDRTELTTLRNRLITESPDLVEPREFEKPVELVRVLLSGSETLLFEANDWPAAFSQNVGRGRVIFTTLGGRGWHRPRTTRDLPSPFNLDRNLPVPLDSLSILAGMIYPEPQPEVFQPSDFSTLLTAEIGYEVVGRRTVAVILGGFVLAVAALGLWLRRSRAPELIGILGPAAAVLAAGVFVATGTASRRAAPSTAAAAAVIEVAPETGEAAVRGLFAVYRPESGTVRVETDHSGDVDLDMTGLDGQTRRRVQTDLDSWHWEDLSFPAGVRMGPFKSTIRTSTSASARFGAVGLEGRLTPGAFRDVGDAVVLSRAGNVLAARLEDDGSFRVGSNDMLTGDQFLPGAVLTDRQQRRQAAYRRFLARPLPPHLEGRDLILAWADAGDVPFSVADTEKTFATALLVVPLEFARPAEGSTVTIPNGFIPFMALAGDRAFRATLARTTPIRTTLQFQLPQSVLPFTVEKATLTARIHAPSRKVTLSGFADKQPVQLQELVNPNGPVRLEITDPRLLRLDAAGHLLLAVAVSERIGPDGQVMPPQPSDPEVKWTIEELGLEVVGRVTGGK